MFLKKVLGIVGMLCAFAGMSYANLVLQDLDYTDHLQTLPNYDRGFYTPQVLHLKPSGTKPVEKPYGKLLHLRAEISEFSSNAWLSIDSVTAPGKRDTIRGVSQDLTEDALNVLQTSFDNIRSNGGNVIVRICYDPWYNGRSNVTPEHKWVLRHVEQLAPVLAKNTDVIVALEMGMHGAYGEMHSDTAITYPRVAEAANLMLRLTPPELKILTRTGNYSAAVLGFENWGVDFNIDGDVFKQIAEAKGDTMYRVGMFNDGYLGTQYDYGTWGSDCAKSICREEGVAWLEKYSINTPYGGEALTTAAGYEVINTPEFLAYEGFRTHTSYLNIQWNNNLIDSWKKSHFTKKDFEYDGTTIDSLTGFKYIEDHLGYRFVLRESWLPDTVYAGEKLKGKFKIQNVGFGNLTRKAAVKLLFSTDECSIENLPEESEYGCFFLDTLSVPMLYVDTLDKVDSRNIHSRIIQINGNDTTMTFDGTNEIEFEVNVPQRPGAFKVYLYIEDVYFANGLYDNLYPIPDNAIHIGSFFLTSKNKPSGIISARMARSMNAGNDQTRVERADQKIQIRDGRGSSNGRGKVGGSRGGSNGRGNTREGIGEKLFRVNGSTIH